jgi:hypothetical protein
MPARQRGTSGHQERRGDDEEHKADNASLRAVRPAGQEVGALRDEFHDQSRHLKVESRYRNLEPDADEPIPCSVPTHHAPNVPAAQRPAASKHREENGTRHRERLPRLKVQEREDRGDDDNGARDVPPTRDGRQHPTAEQNLLGARLHYKAGEQYGDVEQRVGIGERGRVTGGRITAQVPDSRHDKPRGEYANQ